VLSAAANRPNIVLVTLDSARSDRMGFLGSKNATPNLDALARQSIIFEHAYAQAPLTVASHATILSGTYPQTHGAGELGVMLATSLPYLPDLLHGYGYRTAAFVGSIQLDPRAGFAPGFARGFDLYDAGFHQVQPGETGAPSTERSASEVIARAATWLNRSGKAPFFLWVQLNGPHAGSKTPYDRAITATDAALGKLISALRAQKVYENAVIVVAADHGESLGAHGEETHGIFLYDETIHVPLLIQLAQGQMAGKRIGGHVRLLDIAPTLLEIAGIPVPSQMQGQSLLRVAKGNPDAGQPVYSRSDFPQQAFGWGLLESWRAAKYLYVRAPKPELYDLSADPNATRNLAQSSKAVLETMAAQLAAFDSHFARASQQNGPGLTSTEMEKLASLGYVSILKAVSSDTAETGIDPKDTIAIANQTLGAGLALKEGKRDEAIAAFRKVLGVQPNVYLAHYGLGEALVEQRKYQDAMGHLHKAIELRPDSAWAHYEMGLALMNTNDFTTSAVHLEITTRQLPEFAAAHSALAKVYEHLGRREDAIRERFNASPAEPIEKPH
jgi:arylsulfatase A-like enzyme